MSVLALDAAGTPRAWVTPKEAICYFAKDLVVWSLGDIVAGFRGGYRNDGSRSYIESPSIIAVRGSGFDLNKHGRVALSNSTPWSAQAVKSPFLDILIPRSDSISLKILSREGGKAMPLGTEKLKPCACPGPW